MHEMPCRINFWRVAGWSWIFPKTNWLVDYTKWPIFFAFSKRDISGLVEEYTKKKQNFFIYTCMIFVVQPWVYLGVSQKID